MGNIQLLDRETGVLKIAASRGFDAPFLTFFETVHENDAACGTALKRGERIVVEDVEASPIVLGTPALAVLLAAGVRAVQRSEEHPSELQSLMRISYAVFCLTKKT